MNKILLGALSATSLLAFAPVANAATFLPGTPEFTTNPSPVTPSTTGTVTGTFQRTGLAATASSTDNYLFKLPRNGLGSGSISTSTATLNVNTDLDLLSVTINGMVVPITVIGGGLIELGGIGNVPIVKNGLNDLAVTYLSRGNGSYSGTLSFVPGIPEPATWAMMILGLGMVGASMRYRRRSTNVSFA